MIENNDILQRIERLESLDAIRQLAAKYSFALDMRNLDALVGLFPEDIQVSKDKHGRAALKTWFDKTLREQFTGTSHHIGGHIIEFEDTEHAVGVIYSKNEHEAGGEWVIMQMMYYDSYERIKQRWYFRRRVPLYWYATDLNKPPIGDRKMRWPGREPYEGGWHDMWPSWQQFWANPNTPEQAVSEPAPLDEFIKSMAGSVPSVRVR